MTSHCSFEVWDEFTTRLKWFLYEAGRLPTYDEIIAARGFYTHRAREHKVAA